MALESVSVAENLDQSKNDDDDLEDGEIPSDEDDDEVSVVPSKPEPEPPKPSITIKNESPKRKSSEEKYIPRNRRMSQSRDLDRSAKHKLAEDWASDVEKAIKAAMEDKSRSKNKNRNRKRSRDEARAEERMKDLKKRRVSEEGGNDDDDEEMLFVRGASPVRKAVTDNSPPIKRDRERDYESGSDYEDNKPVRENNREVREVKEHRDNRHNKDNSEPNRKTAKANRRNAAKNERQANNNNSKNNNTNNNNNNNSNKNRARNERNNRRNQVHEQNQDPDSICVYYMQGKCHRGDDCPFSHNALPPRKMELCKFYLMDCCAKRDKCLYMHQDFPCKFFHTGLKCTAAENCKFSHQPLNEQVKNILLKHLETAPKEILGNFPRLSREGAMFMINNTEKNLLQGNEPIPCNPNKIPSLLEVRIPNPMGDHKHDEDDPMGKNSKDKKMSKKTRWGSDEDRVPYDVLIQSVNQQLGLKTSVADAAMTIQKQVTMNFYNENSISANVSETVSVEEEKPKIKSPLDNLKSASKDVDLRQLIAAFAPPAALDVAKEMPKPSRSVEESDNEDNSLVIEVPNEGNRGNKNTDEAMPLASEASETFESTQDIPSNLPKRTQELFMRIQQQQREAVDSYKNLENLENKEDSHQVDWYSDDNDDDDDDDDDDEESGHLTIVGCEDDEPSKNDSEDKEDDSFSSPLLPAPIPQPAAIVEKLGGPSKAVDISMEVSKLLSSIKAQSSAAKAQAQPQPQSIDPPSAVEQLSRDPRMSRDPRQRGRDQEILQPLKPSLSPVVQKPAQQQQQDLRFGRLETSIYSSGIITGDSGIDKDQDHRRKDMDLRQCFGDTDLRRIPGATTSSVTSDVDLRPMLNLPFKPVPSHVPCTEIDAGLSSHAPIPYRVHIVDIPRPDYTGLKLTRNDPQVRYDPRLRKIFRLSSDEIADSPMSPPPMMAPKPDTPKSPPLVRTDPRRKALEAQIPPKVIPTTMLMHPPPPLHHQQMDNMGHKVLLGNMPPGMMGPSIPPLMMGNGPPPQRQDQMNYDPRMNQQHRNNGMGLLGPAPAGFGPGNFDGYNDGLRGGYNNGPPQGNYQQKNYGRDFPMDPEPNFGDWNNQNNRMNNRKDRRRPMRGKFSNMSRNND